MIQPVQSFGYFSWKPYTNRSTFSYVRELPSSCYRRLCDIASPDEILDQIDWEGRPNSIVESICAMPLPPYFTVPLAPFRHRNQYPFGQSDVAALRVAARRGLDLDSIDFYFGGSALGMLATRNTCDAETAQEVFYCARIPGLSRTLMVVKRKNFVQDRSVAGFQFERLVTGQRLDERDADCTTNFHLHLVLVSCFRVLISRETDATTPCCEPVEIKANNPRWWSQEMVVQLVSGGCATMVHGDRYTRQVRSISLSSLVSQVFGIPGAGPGQQNPTIRQAEDSIFRGMVDLAAAAANLQEGMVHHIRVDATTRGLRVSPVVAGTGARDEPWRELLPPSGVVRELLQDETPYIHMTRR
jgi:hypothetical protein